MSKMHSSPSLRLAQCFSRLAQDNRCAFIPFITAGDPHQDQTLALLHALAASGADAIELGMPFTDPAADGPIIQNANRRALQNGITTKQILAILAQFRKDNDEIPIILMGYANPLHAYGIEQFGKDAKNAGADGIITVDMPMEEDFDTDPLRHHLCVIRLVAPTSDEKRIAQLCKKAQGFIYSINITGITGTKEADLKPLKQRIDCIKKHCALPVAVGFGIRNEAQAKKAAQIADGIVIGSAFVETIAQHKDDATIHTILATKARHMADAIHGARL